MAGSVNPFSRRETHDAKLVWAYKILSVVTWLLALVASIYYAFKAPTDGKHHLRHTIWGQNRAHPTAFSLNSVVTSIYWIVLYLLQVVYVYHFFHKEDKHVQDASSVASHFILNNLLHFGFILLFVRSHFAWAEVLLVANFINLSSLYFRHNTYARFIHGPAVAGPLAWTFVALYWNGAISVGTHSLPARIVANIFIWGILVYGAFFLVVFKDYTIGIALSTLALALALGQFFTKVIAFQWIFAFVIFGLLTIATTFVAIPGLFGQNRKDHVVSDQERAPLLDDA